ncbi:MAG: ATP-binding protein [Thermodesulfobacteriota bacterium]|nr:ATP-binding protein [Thermodesulfobacteriota bacterium]
MFATDNEAVLEGVPVFNSVGNLLWYLLGRAFIVTLFLGGTVFVGLFHSFELLYAPNTWLFILLSATFLQICFSLLWLLRWQKRLRLFIQFQLVWDLILSVLTVYVTGGVASLFPFLFIFVILSCALMSSRAELYVTVATAVILYGGLVDLQYYGYLPLTQIPLMLSETDICYRLFLNVVAFILAGILGSILSTRLRSSEQQLQRERHDYAELERLNHTILQSIPSGLIVTDNSGEIFSFNAAASVICQLTIVQARHLSLIFPTLHLNSAQLPVERSEFNYVNNAGEKRIVGYSASAIPDCEGEEVKILLTFQDLTETKRLEDHFYLGERLAAIGKLAAGLAHEIRNPLASLSGSVQLLSENVSFNASDQRLIDIVQRETMRLNHLVSDFLIFAKPRLPKLVEYNIVAIFQEVLALAKNDPLFSDVALTVDCKEEYVAMLDPDQIHQALWNLLVNAAQFAVFPKKITIGLNRKKHYFWVDDNGKGVSDAEKKKVFEPFFTSRADGIGLGLSTVHSIVIAHGGTVECYDNPWGGARFQVMFKMA